jgi:hypothetical protein
VLANQFPKVHFCIELKLSAMKKHYFLSMMMASLAMTSVAQDPSLEAYMSFNASATAINNGNVISVNPVGTNYGATLVDDRNGNPQAAVWLDGESYIDFGDHANFRFGMDDFTVMFWMYGDATQTGSGVPVGKRGFNGGQDYAYLFTWTASTQQALAYHRDNNGSANNWPTVTIPAGEWHHLTMVFERAAGLMYVYVDGAPTTAADISNLVGFDATGNQAGQLMVGRSSQGGQFFKGAVDELYIFRRALTTAEVTSLAGLCPTVDPPVTSNQSFCPNSSPTVADLQATGDGMIGWFDFEQSNNPLDPSTPLEAGTYTVMQMIDNCLSDPVEIQVDFNLPAGPPTLDPPLQAFCGLAYPSDINVLSFSGDVNWYLDEVGGSPLSEAHVLMSGTYYASQYVNSCESIRVPAEIIVTPVPDAPIVFDQSLCAADFPTVSALNTNPAQNPGVNVFWYAVPTDGGILSGAAGLMEGTYYAEANNGCPSATRTPVEVTLITVDNTMTVSGGSLTANQEGASYEWFFCVDGFGSMGVTTQTFNPTSEGGYAVVVNVDGCTATSTCQWTSEVVGIDEAGTDALTAYPNPTSGILNLTQPASGQVLDLSGRSLLTFSNARSIDLSGLASGSYVVRTSEGAVMRVVRE